MGGVLEIGALLLNVACPLLIKLFAIVVFVELILKGDVCVGILSLQ